MKKYNELTRASMKILAFNFCSFKKFVDDCANVPKISEIILPHRTETKSTPTTPAALDYCHSACFFNTFSILLIPIFLFILIDSLFSFLGKCENNKKRISYIRIIGLDRCVFRLHRSNPVASKTHIILISTIRALFVLICWRFL